MTPAASLYPVPPARAADALWRWQAAIGLLLACLPALVCLPAGAAEPQVPLTLDYQAYLAGAPVGNASVTLSLAAGGYRVEGDARANGWIKGFTQWRNRFFATGRLTGGVPEPGVFRYLEEDGEERRVVVVEDGTLQVTKNGRQRPRRQAPAGPDLISALFVAPRCSAEQTVHTGRHRYRLTRLEADDSGCRYRVVDEDEDTFELDMDFARQGGLVVPRRITVRGWMTGWIELVEAAAAPRPAGASAAGTAPAAP